MVQSGAVSPSPVPFAGSLLETPVTDHVTAEQLSDALTLTATGVILWFGGPRVLGVALTDAMTGAVVSGEHWLAGACADGCSFVAGLPFSLGLPCSAAAAPVMANATMR